MNLILTMAGKYSRFREEGFKIPKYLLPWGNRTILSETLHLLLAHRNFEQVFLIVNQADQDYFGHVKKIMHHYRIDLNNLIVVGDTTGQANTAYLGLKQISKLAGTVVFHNIDTLLYGRDLLTMQQSLEQYEGYIDVFSSHNHGFSYVLVENNTVKAIAEKVLVSDLATSGLYGFASASLYLEYYQHENYISEVYKKMLAEGYAIGVSPTYTEKQTVVLGTPSEYLAHSRAL